ncbi:MAG: ATPase [Clostridiales bacterium]|nr:ATPase [Clostridiales bacterium]
MIVPMSKVSLIILEDKKRETLKVLRKLGLLHVEIFEGYGENLVELQEQITLLESSIFAIGKNKKVEQVDISVEEALAIAKQIKNFEEEKALCQSEKIMLVSELERLKQWGEIDTDSINELKEKGVEVYFYETSKKEYDLISKNATTVRLNSNKSMIRFALIKSNIEEAQAPIVAISVNSLVLPQISTTEMREKLLLLNKRIDEINANISSSACYLNSIKQAIKHKEKEVEFETYATGMTVENLSLDKKQNVSIAYFKGYIENENLDKLKRVAIENSWGLFVEEPTNEDNVPTKLKNNRFVSLIYPLTDFLGTVPGYFEHDISSWFLMFILIFFGIIFGDGGYGLLICFITAILIIYSFIKNKKVSPMYLLIGLFGLSTVLWGTITCTWFGLSSEVLPNWLKSLSIPWISNVYADKIWYPFWTNGEAGLTTAQNLQIVCFSLALIQLTVAHIKCSVKNKGSIKILGDVGAILQLLGIYYLVLSLVVNSQVFSFGLLIGGIPIGAVAIALIGIGFVLSFVFSNYEGNILKSITSSCKNIVSVILGVVNVFSDIVSYIRLWAVGLAGAAISATVNVLAGPLLGNFMFMLLAIFLLVFGHGLNIILNVLSVIVHGIRLNTLEFSSHLDMSWSGHKFKPFKEKFD